jgi:hypothetical protein
MKDTIQTLKLENTRLQQSIKNLRHLRDLDKEKIGQLETLNASYSKKITDLSKQVIS